MRRTNTNLRTIAAAAIAALSIVAGLTPARADVATCAPAARPGGDWPMFGGDLAHTRHQPEEKTITPGRAATLAPVWGVTPPNASFSGTPTVANGCVYVGSQTGWAFAFNADTGALVWQRHIESNPEVPFSSGGAGINSSITVANGTAYASVTTYEAPYVAALDAATGELLWTSTIEEQTGAGTHSSPMVAGDLILAGWDTAGIEFDPLGRMTAYGGFSIIDANTGALLKRTYTIPAEDRAARYSGGNIWSSFAADLENKVAYVGTSAPYSPEYEHERTNAILKVDIDRDSPTFGEIIGSYKGTPDYYLKTNGDVPCTVLVPGSNFVEGAGECMMLDLDFAASPNLFRDGSGRLLVGELQKSGVYHIADATTMEGIHQVIVGGPAATYAPVNLGTATFDGSAIYGVAGSNNNVFALDRDSGDFNWLSASPDAPLRANPTSSANGVLYTVSTAGLLTAFDARTGTPLLARSMGNDVGEGSPTVQIGMGAGVSIARNTIYAVNGRSLVAYRPDAARAADAETLDAVLAARPGSPARIPHLDGPPV